MKIKEDGVYYGEIKIWSPSQNKFILTGRAIFIPKDDRLYIKFEESEPLTLEEGHRIVFQLDSNSATIVSLDGYVEQIQYPFSSGECKYTLRNYILCKDMEDAEFFLEHGFNLVDFSTNGINSNDKTHIDYALKKATYTKNASVELIFERKYSNGIAIKNESSFSYNSSGDKIKNTLHTKITFPSEIKLTEYDKIICALELYWDLYKSDTDFSITNITIMNSDHRATIYTRRTFYEVYIPNKKALFVDKQLGNESELHSIFSIFTSDRSKDKKISYGFSKYLDLKKSGTLPSYDIVVIEVTIAIDNICGTITKKKISKKEACESISKIQEAIRKMPEIDEQTKSFYCDSPVSDIYASMTRVTQKELIALTCNKLDIEYSEDDKNSMEAIFDARNSIIHGKKYDKHKMLDDFRSKQTIDTLVDDSGRKIYTFGYKEGHVAIAMNLLKRIGIKYFKQHAPTCKNPQKQV